MPTCVELVMPLSLQVLCYAAAAALTVACGVFVMALRSTDAAYPASRSPLDQGGRAG